MRWQLAWRHLKRHWGINLLLVVNVLIGATSAAALPIYGTMVADDALQSLLRDAPATARSLTYRGEISPLEVAKLDALLGELVQERVQFRERRLAAVPAIFRDDDVIELSGYTGFLMHLWSIQPLSAHAELLTGRMPAVVGRDSSGGRLTATLVEAAVGTEAAETLGLKPGDRLRAQNMPLDIIVVGIVQPRDPSSEIWREETTPLPFTAWRRVGFSPDIDEMTLSILLPSATMESLVTPLSEWRYVLDLATIDSRNAAEIHTSLLRARAQRQGTQAAIDTGLIDLIGAFQEEQRAAETVATLLLVQSLLAILLGTGLFAHFAVEQARETLATLAGRGVTAWQQAVMLAWGALPLFLIVALAAPVIAWASMRVGMAGSVNLVPLRIPAASWFLAAGVSLVCWLTLFGASYRRAHHLAKPGFLASWRREAADRRSGWLVEAFVLALGGLAYWQLRQVSGAWQGDDSSLGPDLLLVLAPTLLLIAGGLVIARLLPWIMRGFALLTRQANGLLLVVSATRLARAPGPSVQVVVLLVWTTALTVFAAATGQTLARQQGYVALYQTGADLRLAWSAAADPSALEARSDVLATSLAVRGEVNVPDSSGNTTVRVSFLAVDPETLPRVSVYPPGVSPFSLQTVVDTMRAQPAGAIPIIISTHRALGYLERGDRFAAQFNLSTVDLEVVAVINEFPTLSGPFIVAPLPALAAEVDFSYPLQRIPNTHELWVNVDNATWEMPPEPTFETIAAAADTLTRLTRNLVTRQALNGMRLNARVLTIVTALAFVSIQYFAFHRRISEIVVLRALGVGRQSWLGILATEALLALIISAVLGIAFGYVLAWSMRPLMQALSAASLGEATALSLELGWPVWRDGVLTLWLIFVVALLALRLLLARVNLARRLRLVQE